MCKLFSFYEEIPEESLDEASVQKCFYQFTFDICQSQHRNARVGSDSNKQPLTIKVLQFLGSEDRHSRFVSLRRSSFLETRTWLFGRQFAQISQSFYRSIKCLQISLPKPSIGNGSTVSKDYVFYHYYKNIIEQHRTLVPLRDKFDYRSALKITNLAYFLPKGLSYAVINSRLLKLLPSSIAKFTISTTTNIASQTSVK